MKKLLFPIVLLLILTFSVPSSAEPLKTFETFWSAVFVDGDLKLAYQMLASEDQELIKTEAPELYSFLIGENNGDLGEVGTIVSALQQLIFSTLGKVFLLEDELGEKNATGTEVLYSVSIPTGFDFIMEIMTWAKSKEDQFRGEEPADPIQVIADAIKEFAAILDNADYKESISFNSFVTVVNEDGKEKLSFKLAESFQKMKMLGMGDMGKQDM